jgi:hypothetical protein
MFWMGGDWLIAWLLFAQENTILLISNKYNQMEVLTNSNCSYFVKSNYLILFYF